MGKTLYTPVPVDQDGNTANFPSSFTKDGSKKANIFMKGYRDYNCRRRARCAGVFGLFVLAAAMATYELGKIHGHIEPIGMLFINSLHY